MGGNGGSPAPLASASRRSSGGGGSPRASGDVVPGAPPLAVSPGGKPTLILDIMVGTPAAVTQYTLARTANSQR